MTKVLFFSSELINIYSAFAIVNKSFKTGRDANGKLIDPIRQRTFATNIPNQLFLISSAGSTDTKFYQLYRDWGKRQIMGDPDYCVLHIDCELAFNPTLHGKTIAPLLSRATVETEMRTNPEKARREYYCQFTTEAGADAIVKRGVITRNEEVYKPVHQNETGDKKYIIAYDPARQRDNSIVTVMEVFDSPLPDGGTEKKGRLVNCINLLDVGKKIKSPMQTPDQVAYLKQMILDYDGGTDGYQNILGVYIDAGAGGGGVNIADFLMQNWVDKAGIEHRGLIDKEFSAEYVKKFPDAVDKVHLMSPLKYKSTMFEAMIEMLNQNKVTFTASYDHKGYLTVFDTDEETLQVQKDKIAARLKKENVVGKDFEDRYNEEISRLQLKTKMIKLDWKDELALSNIDAMKEEIVNFVRKKRESGNDSFELTPEKAGKLNDDRCYTLAMASYALSEERRKSILQRQTKKTDKLVDRLPIIKAKRI